MNMQINGPGAIFDPLPYPFMYVTAEPIPQLFYILDTGSAEPVPTPVMESTKDFLPNPFINATLSGGIYPITFYIHDPGRFLCSHTYFRQPSQKKCYRSYGDNAFLHTTTRLLSSGEYASYVLHRSSGVMVIIRSRSSGVMIITRSSLLHRRTGVMVIMRIYIQLAFLPTILPLWSYSSKLQ